MHPLIEKASDQIPAQRLCDLADLPRSSYYRARHVQQPRPDPNQSLLWEIRTICEEMQGYGSPRVTQELHRRGYRVNHKRVARLMDKANLQCRRKKRFVRTTDSSHDCHVYPNVAKDVVVERPDQLWRADITYIRLVNEVIYLAVILDAFSRRVVGWALARHIDAALTVGALKMAIEGRHVQSGLMHHSDRGVQYACDEYIALLLKHKFVISMSRKGNPYDNAMAESFMKTLKTEEVYINEYDTFTDAYRNIEHFIESVYNQKRLHSSLGYLTPCEKEADYHHTQKPILAVQETVSTEG
jgi:transposase InsO family protein